MDRRKILVILWMIWKTTNHKAVGHELRNYIRAIYKVFSRIPLAQGSASPHH